MGLILFNQPVAQPDAPRFGDLPTWVHTEGMVLYDSTSGNLDIGQYEIVNGTMLFGHLATTTTATTTRPAGYYVPPNALGLTRVHRIGFRYIDYFSDGSAQWGDPAVDSLLGQLNAQIPVKGAPNTTPL